MDIDILLDGRSSLELHSEWIGWDPRIDLPPSIDGLVWSWCLFSASIHIYRIGRRPSVILTHALTGTILAILPFIPASKWNIIILPNQWRQIMITCIFPSGWYPSSECLHHSLHCTSTQLNCSLLNTGWSIPHFFSYSNIDNIFLKVWSLLAGVSVSVHVVLWVTSVPFSFLSSPRWSHPPSLSYPHLSLFQSPLMTFSIYACVSLVSCLLTLLLPETSHWDQAQNTLHHNNNSFHQ